jgi:hypothetical protein
MLSRILAVDACGTATQRHVHCSRLTHKHCRLKVTEMWKKFSHTMRNKIPSNTTNVKYIKILNYQERHVSTQLRGHHQEKVIKQVIVHKMYTCLTGFRSFYKEV